MTPNFEQALAEHGSAKEAIKIALYREWQHHPSDAVLTSFEAAAQWVLDNAAAIAAHQSTNKANEFPQLFFDRINAVEQTSEDRYDGLEARLSALEDAPGPRPNQEEVSALRQRMDALTELLQKQTKLDKPWEDALARVKRDVAALQDLAIICLNTDFSDPDEMSRFPEKIQGLLPSEPQTPEARKLLGLDVQPTEPEHNKWISNCYGTPGCIEGYVLQGPAGWVGVAGKVPQVFDTSAEARAWVEAQFNQSQQ